MNPRRALLAGAVLLVYLNALAGPFQFDDFNVIVDNPAVHSLGAWAHALPGIRPLLKASYALNWVLGPGPLGFHALNIALHAANAWMVHALLRRFCPGRENLALAGALLFALHPAMTEAVTYISGRSVSLMAFFYLASLLAHGRGWRVASGGLFVLAFLVKETALTLPLAVVLWDRAEGRTRIPWVQGVLGLLLLAAAPLYQGFLAFAWQLRGPGHTLPGQLQGITYLLRTFLWPFPLSIDPTLAPAGAWGLAGRAALLAALAALALWQRRRRPTLALGLAWFLLHLLPTQSLLPRLDLVNERQLYLAAPGLLVALLACLPERSHRWVLAAALPLAALTFLRNRDYASERALWTQTVRVNPANPRAHNNLGWACLEAGDREGARREFQRALDLDPGYGRARANLEAMGR